MYQVYIIILEECVLCDPGSELRNGGELETVVKR